MTMKELLRSLNLGLVVFDEDGRIDFANDFCLRRGLLSDSFLHRKYYEAFRSLELIGLIGEMLEERKKEGDFEFGGRSYRVSLLGGEARAVQIEDVSEIVRLNKVQKEFVAAVSHELSTPVSAVKGLLETYLFRGDRSDELIRRALKRIGDIEKLVESVKMLVALEGEELKGNEEVSIEDIIASVLDDLSEEVRSKSISVKLDLKEKVLRGDREKIYILLRNIVDNAVKYNVEGGSLTVSSFKEGSSTVVEVRDTGTGIPKEDMPFIFMPFFGGRRKGMGLGLAISRKIAQGLGAELSVKSEEGRGTTVRITFRTYNQNP